MNNDDTNDSPSLPDDAETLNDDALAILSATVPSPIHGKASQLPLSKVREPLLYLFSFPFSSPLFSCPPTTPLAESHIDSWVRDRADRTLPKIRSLFSEPS